jgi:cytidylate kinase
MMASFVITIDGPAASGKSTVARLLAQRLGAVFLDTGAMYRAVTLAAMQEGVRLSDEQALLDVLNNTKFEFRADADGMSAFVDDVDVTAQIRRRDVTENSRYIAAAPKVRAALVEMQRDFAAAHEKVVTEGRDQGTIAFPNADVKFFLTADIETRAKRRMNELKETERTTLDGLIKSIEQRDAKDSGRTEGPLKAADDAILIDTTDLNLEQVVELLVSDVRSRCS